MQVGFRVGSIQKVLQVAGNRVWQSNGPSSPEPFLKMPLVYERAFGGIDQKSSHPDRDWDWRNPVGTGFSIARDHLTGTPLPNIEYANESVRSWKDRPRPAGFGAIEGHWQPRAVFAGTYDEAWMKNRQPLLPTDFDDRFWQSAPQDQQAPAFMRGGEQVVLYRLTAGRDKLHFLLPRVFLGFETRYYDGTGELHRNRKLHTVILEPDYPRVSLVWHTALQCHVKMEKLERTIVSLKTHIGRSVTEDIETRDLVT